MDRWRDMKETERQREISPIKVGQKKKKIHNQKKKGGGGGGSFFF